MHFLWTSDYKQRYQRSPHAPNRKFDSGICGGYIKGDCRAGKQDLTIYCVDIDTKQKQDDNTENLENTDASASESSAADANSDAAADSGTKYISVSFDAAWGADDTIQ